MRIEILNCVFRNIYAKARNMIYLAWGENESSKKDIKIITIIETLFTNCSAIIPGMEAIIEVKQDIEENSFYY